MAMPKPWQRPRRLRGHPALRRMVRQYHWSVDDLIMPLFVTAGSGVRDAITGMADQYRYSVDCLAAPLTELVSLGVPAVLLFGLPAYKDAQGSAAWQAEGVVQQALATLQQVAPQLLRVVDLCCCEYTNHGHCGVLAAEEVGAVVDNDATLALLCRQALSLAAAGAQVIAPSGMMDGAIAALRQALDEAGYTHVLLMSYAVKYHSALYGPFRQAVQSQPQQGDRRTYQMDPANADEALREVALDVQEGADFLMVKPAQTYLDVLYRVKQAVPELPLVAYQVSGEYSLIKQGAAAGLLDERAVVDEWFTGLKRAGADLIISYYALAAARWRAEMSV